MFPPRKDLLRRSALVTIATALSIFSPAAVTASAETQAAPTSAIGIRVLQEIKSGLTPAERKLPSQLVVESKLRTDHALAAKLPRYRTGLGVDLNGRVELDVSSASPTATGEAVVRAGGSVTNTSADVVRVKLPLLVADDLAARQEVRGIRLAAKGATARMPGAPNHDATVGRALRRALATGKPTVTEGDHTHGADTARQAFSVTGAGVKVCVISDGVDSLKAAQAAGELPDVDVLPGQAGSGDEGTAILEVVHDVAPGATLGFAAGLVTEENFADNIRALQRLGHCRIIVDDLYYLDETPFQDTQLAQAVDEVAAAGVLYVSSAGNQGNLTDATTGYYAGEFRASATRIDGINGVAHDFDPGSGTQTFDPLSPNSYSVPVTLFWSDPWGRSDNDYDLYVMNSAGEVVASSTNLQNGAEDPYETAMVPDVKTEYKVAVVKAHGADRFFALNALYGRFVDSGTLKKYSTRGVSHGHASARGAISVAAAPAATAYDYLREKGDPPNPAGPYPGVFTERSKWERFSSDGPSHVFYLADGRQITPGDVSATGGVRRLKPDLTAADGVTTTAPGFETFYGTSAAAPHVAAIAALLVSARPSATNARIRAALTAGTLDLGRPGFDSVTGHGMLMAGPALARLLGPAR